jgi:purine-binding chemotaxis protein CheW
MDLAKIRQKARQEQDNRHIEVALPTEGDLPVSTEAYEIEPPERQSDEDDFFQNNETSAVHIAMSNVTLTQPSFKRGVSRDPIEVILAGRETAGCCDDKSILIEVQEETGKETYQEFLCFKVSNEVYGVDIMDIKELIKPREVTEIPRAPSFVSGIISLRGVIIPIIDMLDRLGLERKSLTGRERVIVVRHGNTFSGLLVDEIIQVARIAKEAIESAPTVLDGIDRDFVTGIGRADGRMIILLNLSNVIDIHLY